MKILNDCRISFLKHRLPEIFYIIYFNKVQSGSGESLMYYCQSRISEMRITQRGFTEIEFLTLQGFQWHYDYDRSFKT